MPTSLLCGILSAPVSILSGLSRTVFGPRADSGSVQYNWAPATLDRRYTDVADAPSHRRDLPETVAEQAAIQR